MAGLKLQTAGMPATIAALEKIFNGYFPKYFFEHSSWMTPIAAIMKQSNVCHPLFQRFLQP